MNRRGLFAAALSVAAAAAVVFAARRFAGGWLAEAGTFFDALTADRPLASAALFFVFATAACAAGLSRLALAALAGAVFGGVEGAALALPSATLGSWLVFEAGKLAGIERVKKLLGEKFRRIAELSPEIGWLEVVLARQLPLPAPAVNLLLAACGTRLAPFLLGTLAGYIPGTLIAALLGSGALRGAAQWQPRLAAALFASALIALLAVRQKARGRAAKL